MYSHMNVKYARACVLLSHGGLYPLNLLKHSVDNPLTF
jgi:hypothetical protein